MNMRASRLLSFKLALDRWGKAHCEFGAWWNAGAGLTAAGGRRAAGDARLLRFADGAWRVQQFLRAGDRPLGLRFVEARDGALWSADRAAPRFSAERAGGMSSARKPAINGCQCSRAPRRRGEDPPDCRLSETPTDPPDGFAVAENGCSIPVRPDRCAPGGRIASSNHGFGI